MSRRVTIRTAIASATILVAGLLAVLFPRLMVTRYTFELRDSVSKSWVWDATITLQGREIRSFYQSSTGPIPMTFTHLRPGSATLTVHAPNYVPLTVPVELHRGNNVAVKPFQLVGYRIPGLQRFQMVESPDSSGLSVQMRPVDSSGHAITTLPCVNLWVGALVSAEMSDGAPATAPVDSGATRGKPLYGGPLRWSWDTSQSATFRYTARIPFGALKSSPAHYLVIDYLVIVPDPRKMSESQVATMMKAAPALGSPARLVTFLRSKRGTDRFSFYFATSWNVPGPGSGGA